MSDIFELSPMDSPATVSGARSASCPRARSTRLRALASRRIPLLQWLPQYDRQTALADVIAGVSLGLTLIPQSIAYASLASLAAQYGLYSSFMGCMLYAIFGTIKEVSIGPTALMAILVFQYCKGLPIEYVILLGFLSGVVIIIMGLLRLGFLVELISLPVTSGFTSAMASVILVSQLKGMLGMRFKAENFTDNLVQLYKKHQMARWQDFVLGMSCVAFLLTLRKIKDLPVRNKCVKRTLWFISTSRNALVVFITASIAYYLELQGPAPFLLSDRVPVGLPPFSLPKFSVTQGNTTATFVDMCTKLGSGILVVPITAVLANIAISKAFTADKKVDATQELVTLGLCQVMGAFVHSMPTTGAFSRSAVSHDSGVRTPISGIYTGVLTLLALTFLTQYFYYIPRATLASILICAVVFMIDYKVIGVMWKGNRWDVFLLLVTYATSLMKGVEVGLLVGVALNLAYLVYLTARPSVEIKRSKTSTGCEYVLVSPGSGLVFLSIGFLKEVVVKAADLEAERVLPVVVDCDKFQAIDYSACKGLEDLTKVFEKRNQKLVFFNMSPKITSVLEPLTKISHSTFHCRCEPELLEVLFSRSHDDHTRSETLPLLSDSFRKKDSICSEMQLPYSLDATPDHDRNRNKNVIIEKVLIESIMEENVDKGDRKRNGKNVVEKGRKDNDNANKENIDRP